MTQRDTTIDRVFELLAEAPREVDCTISQVLVAAGMFVSAVLREAYSDHIARQAEADWFCKGLQTSVARTKATTELTVN